MPLCPLAMPVTVVQPELFCYGGPKRGNEATYSGGGCGWAVSSLPCTVGNFFGNFMYENIIFLDIIIMLLLGGRLCEVVYTNPLLPPFLNLFYFNERRGVPPPTVGTCLNINFVYKNGIFLNANVIIRGIVCVVA